MNKSKEQCLNIISKRFGEAEIEKSFDELSLSLEDSIKEISGAEYGLLFKFDTNSDKLMVLNKNRYSSLVLGDSILKSVLLSKQGFYDNFVVSHKRYNKIIDNPFNIQMKSMLIIPILDRGKSSIIGFIQAVNSVKSKNLFSRYDIRMLALLESNARDIISQYKEKEVVFIKENSKKISDKIDRPSRIAFPKSIRRKTKSDLELEIKLHREKVEELEKELKQKEKLEFDFRCQLKKSDDLELDLKGMIEKSENLESNLESQVVKNKNIEESLRSKTEELKSANSKVVQYQLIALEEESAQSELKDWEKIETIFEFLTNEVTYLAHEEHKIYLFLEIIRNSLHNKEQLRFIDNELTDSLFINKLANKLYTRKKMVLSSKEFNPFGMLHSLSNLYGASLSSRGVLFNTCIDPKLPNLLISDVEKIKSLLIHLLNSLCCLAGDNGVVELSIVYSNIGNSLDIEVKGMRRTERSEIKKFFKKNRVVHSLVTDDIGLGLSISSNLINILGGKLTLATTGESEHSFKVNIPVEIGHNSVRNSFISKSKTKVGILMSDDNIDAYNNIKKYLLSFGIEDYNILVFKNYKKMNSYKFFHLICFENMYSSKIDIVRYTSISIFKYLEFDTKKDYGKDIEVHELYLNSYYGMTLQKILFPEIHTEEFVDNTLLVEDSFFNKVVNRFKKI